MVRMLEAQQKIMHRSTSRVDTPRSLISGSHLSTDDLLNGRADSMDKGSLNGGTVPLLDQLQDPDELDEEVPFILMARTDRPTSLAIWGLMLAHVAMIIYALITTWSITGMHVTTPVSLSSVSRYGAVLTPPAFSSLHIPHPLHPGDSGTDDRPRISQRWTCSRQTSKQT